MKLILLGTFTSCVSSCWGNLGEYLAVDAAGNIELGLRGDIVAVIGALAQLN